MKAIKNLRQYTSDELYLVCQKLYIVDSNEFVGTTADKLGFPLFIDDSVGFSQYLTEIKLMIPDGEHYKIDTFPLNASISFYKNMIKDEIVALAYPSSMVVHFNLFNEKVIDLFPLVKDDQRNKLFKNCAESSFSYWCEKTLEDINQEKTIALV